MAPGRVFFRGGARSGSACGGAASTAGAGLVPVLRLGGAAAGGAASRPSGAGSRAAAGGAAWPIDRGIGAAFVGAGGEALGAGRGGETAEGRTSVCVSTGTLRWTVTVIVSIGTPSSNVSVGGGSLTTGRRDGSGGGEDDARGGGADDDRGVGAAEPRDGEGPDAAWAGGASGGAEEERGVVPCGRVGGGTVSGFRRAGGGAACRFGGGPGSGRGGGVRKSSSSISSSRSLEDETSRITGEWGFAGKAGWPAVLGAGLAVDRPSRTSGGTLRMPVGSDVANSRATRMRSTTTSLVADRLVKAIARS